jgi:hypothetical protein
MTPLLLLLALAAPAITPAPDCREAIEGTWRGTLADPSSAESSRSLVVFAASTGEFSASVFQDSRVVARATGEWTCSGAEGELVFTKHRSAGSVNPLGGFDPIWILRATGPESSVAQVGPDGATLSLEKEKATPWPPAGWNDTVVPSSEDERDAVALLQCQLIAGNNEALFVALANAMDPAASLPEPKTTKVFINLARTLVDEAFLERALNQVLREHAEALMSGRGDPPAAERDRQLSECAALRTRVLARTRDAAASTSDAAD